MRKRLCEDNNYCQVNYVWCIIIEMKTLGDTFFICWIMLTASVKN